MNRYAVIHYGYQNTNLVEVRNNKHKAVIEYIAPSDEAPYDGYLVAKTDNGHTAYGVFDNYNKALEVSAR